VTCCLVIVNSISKQHSVVYSAQYSPGCDELRSNRIFTVCLIYCISSIVAQVIAATVIYLLQSINQSIFRHTQT